MPKNSRAAAISENRQREDAMKNSEATKAKATMVGMK